MNPTAIELDLRPTAPAELFPALHQAYLKLKPGTCLRAIVDKNPRQSYMGFVRGGHSASNCAARGW